MSRSFHEPRTITRRFFLAGVGTALASACLPAHMAPVVDDDSDLVSLSIVNHHRLNVTVFNVAQGRRDRIGEVTAAATATFPLHLRRLVGNEIQLLADAIGSPETVRSELLHLSAGDTVEWTLETELNRSHVMLR